MNASDTATAEKAQQHFREELLRQMAKIRIFNQQENQMNDAQARKLAETAISHLEKAVWHVLSARCFRVAPGDGSVL